MTISVVKWMEPEGKLRMGEVSVNGLSMKMLVCYDASKGIDEYKNITAEYDYKTVRFIEKIMADDDISGIYPNGADYKIIGRVHQIIGNPDGSILLDLYIQNGPEFITIESSDMKTVEFKIGDYICVTLSELCCYPTWL